MVQGNREPPGLRIVLIPLGDVDPAIIQDLGDDLPGIFAAEIAVYPGIPLGRKHLVKERGQYIADDLLADLSSMVSEPGTVLLGITGGDLFSPGMNFVFGIATAGRALVSFSRLRPEFYGEQGGSPVLRKRVLTEAVHELGHALGLGHCEYPGCVMYFSNRIGDTDRKGPGFCFRCARTLERLMVTGGR